jgi:hypothetical protein
MRKSHGVNHSAFSPDIRDEKQMELIEDSGKTSKRGKHSNALGFTNT